VSADLLAARRDPGEAGLAGVWEPGGFEVEYAEPGGREVRAGLGRLLRADLGSCLPARSFPSYKEAAELPGLVLVGHDGAARRVRVVGGARAPGRGLSGFYYTIIMAVLHFRLAVEIGKCIR
jgi:hypothetical protein